MNKRDFLRLAWAGGMTACAGVLASCVEPVPRRTVSAYDYYYYPDVDVYYWLDGGYYYYRTDRGWLRTRVLPPYIILNPQYRRPLLIRQPDPWRWNHRHRERLGVSRRTPPPPWPTRRETERRPMIRPTDRRARERHEHDRRERQHIEDESRRRGRRGRRG